MKKTKVVGEHYKYKICSVHFCYLIHPKKLQIMHKKGPKFPWGPKLEPFTVRVAYIRTVVERDTNRVPAEGLVVGVELESDGVESVADDVVLEDGGERVRVGEELVDDGDAEGIGVDRGEEGQALGCKWAQFFFSSPQSKSHWKSPESTRSHESICVICLTNKWRTASLQPCLGFGQFQTNAQTQ